MDGGIHFEPIFERYGTLSMGWMAIAPSNQDVLYLGTGEPMHARASTHGNGVWKSTDAGKTWTNVGLTKSYFIPKVEVDFKNPDIVYVAAEGKLYDNEMDCERGLYKSTDGGKTWANVFPVKDRGVADFVIDPRNSNVIIAAAYKTFRRAWTYMDRWPGNDLYKTTDGGKTWKKLTNGLPERGLGSHRPDHFRKESQHHLRPARSGSEPRIYRTRRGGEFPRGRRLPGGGGGGGGRGGGAAGTVLFPEGYTFDQFKTYKINPDIAKLAPKFTPITAENEADLVKKLNDMIQDKDFLAKNGIDIAKLNQAARKVYAKDDDIIGSIDEIEKLMKKEPAAADSTEAKGRAQIINRHALRDPVCQCAQHPAADQEERRRVSHRRPGRDLEDDDGIQLTGGGSAQVNQTEGGYYGRIIVDQTNDQVVYCGDTNTTVSRDGGKTFQATGWDGNGEDPRRSSRGMDRSAQLQTTSSAPTTAASAKPGTAASTGARRTRSAASSSSMSPWTTNSPTTSWAAPRTTAAGWAPPRPGTSTASSPPTGSTSRPATDSMLVRDWWNPEFFYWESQFGASQTMNLKTGESSQLAPRLTPEQTAAGAAPLRYQWNAPIVLSPHNPGIVYVCSQYVHRSLTRGDRGTFVTISPDLSKASKEKLDLSRKTNLQWATIYTFAESPKKPGLYWAGTDDGNVQMSPDGGNTWVNITNQFYDATGKAKPGIKGDLIPYDRWVKRVVPSAFDENTCYVGFSGYRTHNEDKTWLFVTKDLGKTWTDISGNMNNPIFDVEEDPDNANVLYLGTDYGLFVTIDQGKTWSAFSNTAPNAIVRDVAIQKRDREIAIGTYGRGIYVADIGPIKEFTPEVFQEAAHLFDIKNTIRWNRIERRGDTLGEMVKADNPPDRRDSLLLPEGGRAKRETHHQGPGGQHPLGDLLPAPRRACRRCSGV